MCTIETGVLVFGFVDLAMLQCRYGGQITKQKQYTRETTSSSVISDVAENANCDVPRQEIADDAVGVQSPTLSRSGPNPGGWVLSFLSGRLGKKYRRIVSPMKAGSDTKEKIERSSHHMASLNVKVLRSSYYTLSHP